MRITDPHIIQTGEKKLISAVQENLDLKTLKNILMERMAETSFASRGGQIVVHDNQIAFRLDFDLKLSGSLLFDRQGNYIPDSPFSTTDTEPETAPSLSSPSPEKNLTDDDNEDDLDLLLEEDENIDVQNFQVQKNDSPDPADDDDLDSDDILDDDIDDILKESREFWEQKKGG